MTLNSRPVILQAPFLYDPDSGRNGIYMYHGKNIISLSGDDAHSIYAALKLCDGFTTVARIADSISQPEENVLQMFQQLESLDVVSDCHEQYRHFHMQSMYPTCYGNRMTHDEAVALTEQNIPPVKTGTKIPLPANSINEHDSLRASIVSRESCRSFDGSKPIPLTAVSDILRYSYSRKLRSSPSGGSLYPLKLFVLNEHPSAELLPGYYEYDAQEEKLVLFNQNIDPEQLEFCFNTEGLPFGSRLQIIIAANLDRQPLKYGNRGYRLTLMEAGQVAQNISLLCEALGLASCELGGTLDEPMREELGFADSDPYPLYPILSIAIGYKKDSPSMKDNCAERLRDYKLAGPGKIISSYDAKIYDGTPLFFAWASGDGKHYSGATGRSYHKATLKAVVEGYEREISGMYRTDFSGPAFSVPGRWIHPSNYIPLTPQQTGLAKLTEFSEQLPIGWIRGYDMITGDPIYVPADLVFYGKHHDGPRIYWANSSGVAAYPNKDGAVKRAVTELIERDAIMRFWFRDITPQELSASSDLVHLQKRSYYWRTHNAELHIFVLPSPYATVFLATLQSGSFPYFSSGAAATVDDDPYDCLMKAVAEAEYSFLETKEHTDPDTCAGIRPEDIKSPADHGHYYNVKEHAETLQSLFSEAEPVSFDELKNDKFDFDNVVRKIKPVLVDISTDIVPSLRVVRALSSKLIPISFGFGLAHYTHPSLKGCINSESWLDYLQVPHFFA